MFSVKRLMLNRAKKKWIKRGRGVEAGGVFSGVCVLLICVMDWCCGTVWCY